MNATVQTRRQSSEAPQSAPLTSGGASSGTQSMVSEPGYSMAPPQSSRADPLEVSYPVCSVEGHDDLAAEAVSTESAAVLYSTPGPDGPPMSTPADVPASTRASTRASTEAGTDQQSGRSRGRRDGNQRRRQEGAAGGAGEMAGGSVSVAGTGPDPPRTATSPSARRAGAQTRGARGGTRRRRAARGDTGEAAEEIPDIRLSPFPFAAVDPLPRLDLPAPLKPVEKPSRQMAAISESDGDKRRTIADARRFADLHFGKVVTDTQLRVSTQERVVTREADRIARETDAKIYEIRRETERADAEIEAAALAAEVSVIEAATEQKRRLAGRHSAALKKLEAERDTAKDDVEAARDVAAEDVAKVMADHAKAYTDQDSAAADRVRAAESTASENIEDFKRRAGRGETMTGIDLHPSYGQREMQRDVNKAVGPTLADQAKQRMQARYTGPERMSSIDVFQMAEGAAPALPSMQAVGHLGYLEALFMHDQHVYTNQFKTAFENLVNGTRETADTTIDTAFEAQKKALKKQQRNAVKSINSQVEAARAQIAQQRTIARETLKVQADSTISQHSDRARSAHDGLAQGLRGTRPHTEMALERLRGTIAGSAMSGPEQLRATAKLAADGVDASIQESGRMGSLQREMIVSDTLKGLSEQQIEARETRVGYASGETVRLAEAATKTNEANVKIVDQTVKTFPPMIEDVKAKGKDGVSELEFVKFIAEEEALRARMMQPEGSTSGGAHLETHGTHVDGVATRFETFAQGFDVPETEEKIQKGLVDGMNKDVAAIDDIVPDIATDFEKIDDTIISSSSEEQALVKRLRGLTRAKGIYFLEEFFRHTKGDSFYDLAWEHLNSNNYNAATLYIAGRNADAAAYELEESVGFFNDDEARMEGAMRMLTPAQLDELDEAGSNTRMGRMRDNARSALGGTDRDVFDALRDANYARADAYRFMEAQRANLRRRDADAAHTTIRSYTSAPTAGAWGPNSSVTADQRRQMIANEMAHIRSRRGAPPTTNLPAEEQQANLQAMADFATGTRTYSNHYRPQDGSRTYTTWRGANHDLARDLILHGNNSREARAAAIGVEIERRRGPVNRLNLDDAVYEPRLNENNHPPDFVVPDSVREEVLRERDEMMMLAFSRYGSSTQSLVTDDPREAENGLIDRLTARTPRDELGNALISGMIREPVPSPETAALAMEYAVRGSQTNEPLIWRFAERMNSEELAEMGRHYRDRTDENLHDRLGLYNHGAGELSGKERLRGNRVFRGMARTDQERAEAAIYAVRQQMHETGGVGADMAEDSLTNKVMGSYLRDLERIAGGRVRFGPEGGATWTGDHNFDPQGAFQGSVYEQIGFSGAVAGTQSSAEAYQNLIDSYAERASMWITALGIVAAAVVTVATGGAAGPLLMAAIAASAGLAGMAAKHAIRGGGYGWEEAVVDLGMTAVDALTAGVGQALGLASRGGIEAARQGMRNGLSISAARQLNASLAGEVAEGVGRTLLVGGARNADDIARGAVLTGSKLGDKVAIGTIGGALGGVGQAALDERTYDPYARGGVLGNLVMGGISGGTVGAFTAGLSHGVENVRLPGLGRTLEEISESGGPAQRGMVEALSGGIGSFGGTGLQLGIDSARGRYSGDLGDAFQAMSIEGLKNAGQGAFEGFGGGLMARRQQRRAAAEQQQRDRAAEAERAPADTIDDVSETVRPPEALPADAVEGTAAGISGSLMRGDVLDVPRAAVTADTSDNAPRDRTTTAVKVSEALRRPVESVGPVEITGASREPFEQRVRIGDAAVGEAETDVVIRQIDDMPRADDGEVPVARLREETLDDGTRGYVVEVSGRAHHEMVRRAVAHELAEIRVIERRMRAGTYDPEAPDRLGKDAPPVEGDRPAREALSPHDHGRLAELETLVQQAAQASWNPDLQQLHQTELHRLADHLGLIGDTPEAAARRQLAIDVLGDTDGMIQRIAAEAAESPFLKPLEGTVDHIFGILADRFVLAEQIDRALGAKTETFGYRASERRVDLPPERQNFLTTKEQILRQAGRISLRAGHFDVNFRKKTGGVTYKPEAYKQLLATAPHARAVLDALAVRLADNNFQHLMRGKATDRYRASFQTGRDPAEMPDALLDLDRVLAPHALDSAKLTDLVGTDPVTVGRMMDVRDTLIRQRRALIDRYDAAPTTELKDQINKLNARLNKVAEVLGEVAGRRVVEQRNETLDEEARFTEVTFEGSGAGLPDLVFRNRSGKDPRLLLIEAKGGDSVLGTRQKLNDPTQRVEQGTYEYLESLAAEMQKSTKPEEVQALGREIQMLLRTDPDQIEYQMVQQRLPESGNTLPPPEVGTFDLTPKTGRRRTGDKTAAAIPESGFHGEARETRIDPVQGSAELRGAVQRLTTESAGTGQQIRNIDEITLPSGEVRQRLWLEDGSVAIVRFVDAETLPLTEDGRAVGHTDPLLPNQYAIRISDRAPEGGVELALAHEVAELVSSRARAADHPAGQEAAVPQDMLLADSDAGSLSPHDEGRIAELDVVARRLGGSGPAADRAREDLLPRIRHLGLDELGLQGDARRQVVTDRLRSMGIDADLDRLAQAVRDIDEVRRLADDLFSGDEAAPERAEVERNIETVMAEAAVDAFGATTGATAGDRRADLFAALASGIRPSDDAVFQGETPLSSRESTEAALNRLYRRFFLEEGAPDIDEFIRTLEGGGDTAGARDGDAAGRAELAYDAIYSRGGARAGFDDGIGAPEYHDAMRMLFPAGGQPSAHDKRGLVVVGGDGYAYVAQAKDGSTPSEFAARGFETWQDDVAFHQFHSLTNDDPVVGRIYVRLKPSAAPDVMANFVADVLLDAAGFPAVKAAKVAGVAGGEGDGPTDIEARSDSMIIYLTDASEASRARIGDWLAERPDSLLSGPEWHLPFTDPQPGGNLDQIGGWAEDPPDSQSFGKTRSNIVDDVLADFHAKGQTPTRSEFREAVFARFADNKDIRIDPERPHLHRQDAGSEDALVPQPAHDQNTAAGAERPRSDRRGPETMQRWFTKLNNLLERLRSRFR